MIKNVLKETLKSIAKKNALLALEKFAMAIYPPNPAAAISATKHLAVAAAAGGAAAAIGGTGSSASRSRPTTPRAIGGSSGPGNDTTERNITVNMFTNNLLTNEQDVGQMVGRSLDAASRVGYRLNSNVTGQSDRSGASEDRMGP
jgi:hypothetical protein